LPSGEKEKDQCVRRGNMTDNVSIKIM